MLLLCAGIVLPFLFYLECICSHKTGNFNLQWHAYQSPNMPILHTRHMMNSLCVTRLWEAIPDTAS